MFGGPASPTSQLFKKYRQGKQTWLLNSPPHWKSVVGSEKGQLARIALVKLRVGPQAWFSDIKHPREGFWGLRTLACHH